MIILAGDELKARLADPDEPLVENWRPEQIQPNGVELTLDSVARFVGGPGRLGYSNADRRLGGYEDIPFRDDEWIHLEQGIYLITYKETVHVHKDLFALARPRSSLLRMGAAIYTALWDTGYYGRSKSLLDVMNPAGIELEKGARLVQLIFFKLGRRLETGYDGDYRGENI